MGQAAWTVSALAELAGVDSSPSPTDSASTSASPSSTPVPLSATPAGFDIWGLILVMVILMAGIMLALLIYLWTTRSADQENNSVVRAWIAVTLVAGVLILTISTLGGDDQGLRNVLVGSLVAATGSAIAFYFASKSAQAARNDVLRAAGISGMRNTAATSLALSKNADTEELADPPAKGNKLTFHFKVTNTGAQVLTGVHISDTLAPPPAGNYKWPDPAVPGVLKPGDVVTATSVYELKDTDLKNHIVKCSATATGTMATGRAVHSDPDPTSTAL